MCALFNTGTAKMALPRYGVSQRIVPSHIALIYVYGYEFNSRLLIYKDEHLSFEITLCLH